MHNSWKNFKLEAQLLNYVQNVYLNPKNKINPQCFEFYNFIIFEIETFS